MNGLQTRLAAFRDGNRLIRADFDAGAKTLYDYVRTHRTRYRTHVGAHFVVALYETDPRLLREFARKQRMEGWHADLTQAEETALRIARDATSKEEAISHLRYGTNVFDHLFNMRQIGRIVGLGVIAGSAGLLVAAGELFFLARQSARGLVLDWTGIDISGSEQAARAEESAALAGTLIERSRGADGTLDEAALAAGVDELLVAIDAGQDAGEAAAYLSGGSSYLVGVLTGVALLVAAILARGIVKVGLEGAVGTVTKIDRLVRDLDAWCDWRLGRTGLDPGLGALPGDLIHPPAPVLHRPRATLLDD